MRLPNKLETQIQLYQGLIIIIPFAKNELTAYISYYQIINDNGNITYLFIIIIIIVHQPRFTSDAFSSYD